MIERRLAPVSPYALFVWGMLLGLAPILTAYVTFENGFDVWGVAIASALATTAVVGLFMLAVYRVEASRSR